MTAVSPSAWALLEAEGYRRIYPDPLGYIDLAPPTEELPAASPYKPPAKPKPTKRQANRDIL